MKVREFKKTVKVTERLLKGVTVTILSYVKLVRENNAITFFATNLEHSFLKTYYSLGPDFTAFVAVTDLAKVGKALKGDEALISFEETPEGHENRIIFTGKQTIKINAIKDVDSDDYPTIEAELFGEFKDGKMFTVPSEKTLFEAIKKMAFTTTKKSQNIAYSGLFFDSANQNLVTTDIHRLSLINIPGLIIPADRVLDMDFLKEMISKKSGDLITIGTGEMYTSFYFGSETWTTRNIAPKFPNYVAVTGKTFDHINDSLSVPKFKEIIGSYADLYDDKVNAVRLTFEDNVLAFFADCGGILLEDKMPIESSLNRVSAFNIKYLKEVFGVFNADTVEVSVDQDKSMAPMFLKETAPEYTFVHCLMPLRVEFN